MLGSYEKALAERATSSYPVSIGTAIALESLFPSRDQRYDDTKERAKPINFDKDYIFLINLGTMFRNLVSSVQSDAAKNLSAEKLAEVLYAETQVIQSLCANEGNGKIVPYFYDVDHGKYVGTVHRYIKFREATTPMAKLYDQKERATIKMVKDFGLDVLKITNRRDFPGAMDSFMLSHYPIELSAYRNYRNLLLVESHTGRIKDRSKWGSKYYKVGDFDMSQLPFTKKLLLLFGDRNHIHPADMKVRKQLVEVAQKGRWTPMTTDSKIIFDIDRFTLDPYLIQFMKGL